MLKRTKRLLLFAAIGFVPRLLAGGPEVVSVDGLKELGVICRRVQLQALTASVEIDLTVDERQTPGKYLGAECVVLKEPVPADKLAAADAAAAEGGAIARRARSTKANPAFLVLGRELARAYLAVEFAAAGEAGGTRARRYLLPVDAIGDAPAEPSRGEAGADDAPGPR